MLFFELIVPGIGKMTTSSRFDFNKLRENSYNFKLAMKSPTNIRFFQEFVDSKSDYLDYAKYLPLYSDIIIF